MKFDNYRILLLFLITIRIGLHTVFGLTGFFGIVEKTTVSVYTVIYSLSFIGIYKKEIWGLILFLLMSLMDGLAVLTNISSINDIIQILFWDGFGIYLAYKAYPIFVSKRNSQVTLF